MSGRRTAGAVAGGLVAGLAITALLVAGERKNRKPSELTNLKRADARQFGLHTPDTRVLPDAREQVIVQGAHLALSAVAGATYAAVTDENTPLLASGLGFGLAFYVAAHWVAGPLLKLKRPEWQSGGTTIASHMLNHLGFGLITAVGARLAAER